MAKQRQLPKDLLTRLQRTSEDPRPVVLMTCGISGAGKTTLSKSILDTLPKFTRLSIDAYIYLHHGTYGVSYPASQYSALQDEAEAALKIQLHDLLKSDDLKESSNVVLDLSFAFLEMRDEWRALIHEGGGREVLVYLDASEETLWSRIEERRRKEVEADTAAVITRETLRSYVKGFEKPNGEGEIIIEVEE